MAVLLERGSGREGGLVQKYTGERKRKQYNLYNMESAIKREKNDFDRKRERVENWRGRKMGENL